MAMVAPAIIGKLGVVKSITLAGLLMSTFSFSLIIIGWRTLLKPDEIGAVHGGAWNFFYS